MCYAFAFLITNRAKIMSNSKEISLVAAALAGGIIAASVPMTADEAVTIFNQVKEALRRRADLETDE